MRGYRTYPFKDHDPIIDIVRTCLQIYAGIYTHSKMTPAVRQVARSSGVSESCIWNWLNGVTSMPRFCTVVAVVHATGREVKVDQHSMGSKSRFRVIKGGKAA